MATTTQTKTMVATHPIALIATSAPISAKPSMKVVLGAMTFGKPGAPGARVHTVPDVAAILDVLQKHGHVEVDTARVYGTSENMLGEAQWQNRHLIISTKLNPRRMGPYQYSHTKEGLERGLQDSLSALKSKKVDIFYLHAPDVGARPRP
jgi:aflatoxin B1 aldehyde reductase